MEYLNVGDLKRHGWVYNMKAHHKPKFKFNAVKVARIKPHALEIVSLVAALISIFGFIGGLI